MLDHFTMPYVIYIGVVKFNRQNLIVSRKKGSGLQDAKQILQPSQSPPSIFNNKPEVT